jgi:UDP-N-acetyl-D-mannosaminuronic acid transferase (WecB/TagA/CpsF family)
MLEADRATLAALVDAGADLANERNVRHYLYGGERNSVEGAAATLRGLGYNVEVADAATGSGFVAIAERRQVVNLESATEARDVFERLAADIPDGEYDGWEAELVEA